MNIRRVITSRNGGGLFILCMVLISGVIMGCHRANMAVVDGDWILVEVSSGDINPYATLSIDPSEGGGWSISGYMGVNHYHTEAVYDTGGKTFTISPVATTRMSGPEEFMERESALLDMIRGVTRWQATSDPSIGYASGDTLTLYSSSKTMRYRRWTPINRWDLVGINDGDSIVSVFGEIIPTLEIEYNEDGTLVARIFGGLNRVECPCNIGPGRTIKCDLDNGISTMVSGDPYNSGMENKYLNLLAKVTHYSLLGDEMTLLDDDGYAVLTLALSETMR